MAVEIRQARPSDYLTVISVIDNWWGGRQMAGMLPRLFFDHFTDTCFAAERDGELAGFLVGFESQSRPAEAYIHFVGIHPGERAAGWAGGSMSASLTRCGTGLPAGPGGHVPHQPQLSRVPPAHGLRHRARRRRDRRHSGGGGLRRRRARSRAVHQDAGRLATFARPGRLVQNSICWAPEIPAADTHSIAASIWPPLASSASAAKIAFLIATARPRGPRRSFSGE